MSGQHQSPTHTYTSYLHSCLSIVLEDSKSDMLKESQPSLEAHIHIAQESKLWFEDGSVVLVAENHPFKVHKGVLAAKSTVFSGMFDVSQRQVLKGNDRFQGVPLVPLSDKWQDVQTLLKGIYYAEA